MGARNESAVVSYRKPTSKRFIDMSGQKYGRLEVIEFAGFQGKFPKWHCKCLCGNTTTVFANGLRSGATQSCGCLGREVNKTHGHSHHPLWSIYHGMLARCYNEKSSSYKNYGGRGITVCDRWRDSFEAFCEDMGERPSPDHSIGREDNHGHYEPSNCRWETQAQQAANTRRCRLVRFNGETKPLSAWADELGITREAMRLRFKKNASLESILTTPRGGIVVDESLYHPKSDGLADDHDAWPTVFTFNEVLHCKAASPYQARVTFTKLRNIAKSYGYKFRGRLLGTHILFSFSRRKQRVAPESKPTT